MKKLFTILLVGTSFLFACKKSVQSPTLVKTSQHSGTTQFSAKLLDNAQTHFLLQDDEPQSISFNRKLRSFSTTKTLQLSYVNDSLKIKFYSPRPIKELKIYAQGKEFQDPLLVCVIDSLPAFIDLTIPLSKMQQKQSYETLSGANIEIQKLSLKDMKLIVKCEDPYYKTLEKITVNWDVWFSGYHPTQLLWQLKLKPLHMREAVALSLNLAYMFSTDQFRDSILNKWQGKLYGDKGPKDIINNQNLYASIIENRGMR